MEVPVGNSPLGAFGHKKTTHAGGYMIRLDTNYRYFADPIAAPDYFPSLASLPARG